jgi:hypothetical protein
MRYERAAWQTAGYAVEPNRLGTCPSACRAILPLATHPRARCTPSAHRAILPLTARHPRAEPSSVRPAILPLAARPPSRCTQSADRDVRPLAGPSVRWPSHPSDRAAVHPFTELSFRLPGRPSTRRANPSAHGAVRSLAEPPFLSLPVRALNSRGLLPGMSVRWPSNPSGRTAVDPLAELSIRLPGRPSVRSLRAVRSPSRPSARRANPSARGAVRSLAEPPFLSLRVRALTAHGLLPGMSVRSQSHPSARCPSSRSLRAVRSPSCPSAGRATLPLAARPPARCLPSTR